MLNIKSISTLLLLASSSLLVAARPGEYPTDKDPIDKKPKPKPAPFCGTCNPISGKNHCDITTSCINTGKRFHCACRAGFKASKDNYDIYKQFRLPFKNFEFLVFTPEYTECDILCDDNTKPANELCQEVPLYKHCEA
ncbi:yeast-phase specific protein yps-3 [Histoplasma ohiense]|nr:yeast-phase specific protein yps-3 [Histoplasma ohiense (nom. inval.)]